MQRTPYASNTFFKEDFTVSAASQGLADDIQWNCSGEGPYAYAKDANKLHTTPVYWQAQASTILLLFLDHQSSCGADIVIEGHCEPL